MGAQSAAFAGNAGVKIKPFSPETMAALKTGLKLSRPQYRLLIIAIGHVGRYIVEGVGCTERAVFAESKGRSLF